MTITYGRMTNEELREHQAILMEEMQLRELSGSTVDLYCHDNDGQAIYLEQFSSIDEANKYLDKLAKSSGLSVREIFWLEDDLGHRIDNPGNREEEVWNICSYDIKGNVRVHTYFEDFNDAIQYIDVDDDADRFWVQGGTTGKRYDWAGDPILFEDKSVARALNDMRAP